MYTVILARGKENEFKLDLPFNSKKEFMKAKSQFKKDKFPDRKNKSPILEFYLQFLPIGTTVEDISPRRSFDLEYYKKKFGQEEGTKKYEIKIKNLGYSRTINAYIDKFGEEEGTKRYLEKNSHLSISKNSLKKNGYTDEEIIEIRAKHANKSKLTLENLINRHGEEIGKEKWDEYINKNKACLWRVSFWTKRGFSEEEAKTHISNIQKRDYEYFIKKYGEIEGKKRHEEMRFKIKHNSKGYSDLEKNVFFEIQKHYADAINGKICVIENKTFLPDIYIPSFNTIIEVFGDYWHCNPKYFNKTFFNKNLRMFANEIWERDTERIKLLEQEYNVIITWERDLNINFLGEINEIIEKTKIRKKRIYC